MAGRALAACAMLLGAALYLPETALAQASPLPEIPDTPDLLPYFEEATRGWLERATQLAASLFAALFLLEVVLSLYAWSVADRGMEELLQELGVKLAVTGFVMVMILNPETLLLPLVRGLEETGARLVGGEPLGPAELMRAGARLGNGLYVAAVPPLGPPGFLANPEVDPSVRIGNILADTHLLVQLILVNLTTGLLVVGGIVLIQAAFLALAAQLLLVKVESFLVLSAGAFFLGFASFRVTAGLAEGYIRYALSVGLRLFLLYVILGIGAQLVGPWGEALAAAVSVADGGPPGPANPPQLNLGVLSLSVGSIALFAYLAWRVPTLVAAQILSGFEVGLGRALRVGGR